MWKTVSVGLIAAAVFGTSVQGQPATGLCRTSIEELFDTAVFQITSARLQLESMKRSEAQLREANELVESSGITEMLREGEYDTTDLLEAIQSLIRISELTMKSAITRRRVVGAISEILADQTDTIVNRVALHCLEIGGTNPGG